MTSWKKYGGSLTMNNDGWKDISKHFNEPRTEANMVFHCAKLLNFGVISQKEFFILKHRIVNIECKAALHQTESVDFGSKSLDSCLGNDSGT